MRGHDAQRREPCHQPIVSSRRSVLAGAAALGIATPFPVFGQTLRIRLDIATFAQDAARLASFEAAVNEMQQRSAADPDDPRGWLANADLHKAVCAPLGSEGNNAPNQAHYGWWVWPWHRAYIWVTEQKIRAISGDDTFCYPYWNWSTDRVMPPAFSRAGSPLARAVRYTFARPLSDLEVDYYPGDPERRALGVTSLEVDHFVASDPADIPHSFGGIVRPNAANHYGRNALEGAPHPAVHNYTGGWTIVNGQKILGDMTDLATAGRDPIFFAHHGNLDRLWEIWRQDPRRKATEPKDDAFLQHKFCFTWLDGTPITVAMADILDTTRLGYVYDHLQVFRLGAAMAREVRGAAAPPLAPVATARVSLPAATPAIGTKPRLYLEIVGVRPPTQAMTVGVFLKPGGASAGQPGTPVGVFAAMSAGGRISWPEDRLLFDITEAAGRYGGPEIAVELIPQRLAPSPGEKYPPLSYARMQIVRS